MGEVKQIEIKTRTYYFYNSMINLKKFDPNLLKIDKKSYKNISIYNIGYITSKKIDDYKSVYSLNPFYLRVNHANGYIEEKSGNKYLIFDTIDESKVLLKYINMFGMELKVKIKIKFNSDEDLPLNKPLKNSCNDYNYRICF